MHENFPNHVGKQANNRWIVYERFAVADTESMVAYKVTFGSVEPLENISRYAWSVPANDEWTPAEAKKIVQHLCEIDFNYLVKKDYEQSQQYATQEA